MSVSERTVALHVLVTHAVVTVTQMCMTEEISPEGIIMATFDVHRFEDTAQSRQYLVACRRLITFC